MSAPPASVPSMEDEHQVQTLQALSDEVWGSVLSYLHQQDQLSATTTCPELCRCIYEVALLSENGESQRSLTSLVRLLGSFRLQSARSIDLSHLPEVVTDALLVDLRLSSTAVMSIDLRGCTKVTDDGIAAIAGRCAKLRELRLEGTSVGSAGIEAVASTCPELARLHLQDCSSVDDGAAAVVAARLADIACLDLSGTLVTDEGIACVVEKCSALDVLKLEGCKEVTNAWVLGTLVRQNPELEIFFSGFRFHHGHQNFCTRYSLRAAVIEWLANENEAEIKYGNISQWDVSNVTNMWRVRSMRSMSTRIVCAAPVTPCEADLLTWSARFHSSMFHGAKTFNGDLSSWNVSNVTDMR